MELIVLLTASAAIAMLLLWSHASVFRDGWKAGFERGVEMFGMEAIRRGLCRVEIDEKQQVIRVIWEGENTESNDSSADHLRVPTDPHAETHQ